MGLRRPFRSAAAALAFAFAFVVSLGCGGHSSKNPPAAGGKAAGPAGTAAPAAAAVETVPAYTYPAPVKGHFKEVNTGDFDLVDGIASKTVGGTVVFVVAKPIASPAIAAAPCPMTLARSLMALRNAGWVEVTLDESGRSKYFAEGTPFGGSGHEEDLGSHPWKSSGKVADGRASGSVEHRHDGTFKFDLPLSSPSGNEPTESGWFQGKRGDPNAARPGDAELTAAYDALHKAAAAKDLKGFLEAQGFDAKQVAAIRGLDGIGTDFAAFADRFLTPGQGAEGSRGPGWASFRAEGVNSKNAKFVNYYWFTTCGDKLVLTRISVNPQ
jgi:hypothetical protein